MTPDPQSYFLEQDAGLWEVFTLRGSKGRTKQTVKAFWQFDEARAFAVARAEADRRGAVLVIRGPKGREVMEFPPPSSGKPPS